MHATMMFAMKYSLLQANELFPRSISKQNFSSDGNKWQIMDFLDSVADFLANPKAIYDTFETQMPVANWESSARIQLIIQDL